MRQKSDRNPSTWTIGAAVAVLLWSGSALAGADGGPPHDADHGSTVELGVAGTVLHDGHHLLGAGGPFVELVLLPRWLHLEVAGLFGRAGHDNVAIFDVVLKYPYHLTEMVTLFGGLGLTVPFVGGEGRTEAHPGLTVVGGACLWLLPPFGVLAQGVFNVLSAGGGAHAEGGARVGIAVHL